jgi:hypothetical protein
VRFELGQAEQGAQVVNDVVAHRVPGCVHLLVPETHNHPEVGRAGGHGAESGRGKDWLLRLKEEAFAVEHGAFACAISVSFSLLKGLQ